MARAPPPNEALYTRYTVSSLNSSCIQYCVSDDTGLDTIKSSLIFLLVLYSSFSIFILAFCQEYIALLNYVIRYRTSVSTCKPYCKSANFYKIYNCKIFTHHTSYTKVSLELDLHMLPTKCASYAKHALLCTSMIEGYGCLHVSLSSRWALFSWWFNVFNVTTKSNFRDEFTDQKGHTLWDGDKRYEYTKCSKEDRTIIELMVFLDCSSWERYFEAELVVSRVYNKVRECVLKQGQWYPQRVLIHSLHHGHSWSKYVWAHTCACSLQTKPL